MLQKVVYAAAIVFGFSTLHSCNNNQDKPDALAVNMDTTIHPGNDFFAYANGGWIKNNPIPGEQSSWGIGNLVIEENLKRLRTINETAAAKPATTGTPEQKIGDFWKAAMDSSSIEQRGLSDVQPYFQQIEAANNTNAIVQLMAKFQTIGVGTLVGSYIGQDDMNSEVMALKFWQSGLSLPEREYYLKTDSTSKAILTGFSKYISALLTLTGKNESDATAHATAIVQLETKLAKVHRTLADQRDPYKNYNKLGIQAFYKLAGDFPMEGYLTTSGLPSNIDSVIVGQPEYYASLAKLLSETPLPIWKSYLQFQLLDAYAEALPDVYSSTKFEFTKLLNGAKLRKPRWKRVLSNEERIMGELLGQLFVKEYFNEKAKQRYENLVQAIKLALKNRIAKLDWMSDSTKQKAYAKLASMKQKVGYPDQWKDFSSLAIVPDSYFKNMVSGNTFWWKYNLNKLGKPVDRNEWEMNPQEYNAYYNPSNNEIVLPAGIFTVPGYRDEELDDALVYGYAGASTIGHEITHGFDDQGRQFDAKGNLTNWWTAKDEAAFNSRAQVMVQQFSQFTVVDTFKINGSATLGENIADLGGVLLGWDAFQLTEQYKTNKPIAGLTPQQRYFLGYSLGWLGHSTQESLRNQVLSDVHSPAKFRVNGPFVSVDAFYDVFKITPQHTMFVAPEKRVRIW
ncbi:MAG TPA: M13 family peptidase [Chitinophagaceae bacterium]|nr:M13 family peptidase [Chitinophagaceae bacterium]HAN37692.1 M13 family peptidase [Chitinophagaceae bacterium]